MKFPSEKELAKIRKKLEKSEGSPQICKQFVIYAREHDLKSKELAKIIGVNESLMSKVLRYRHQRFSTDKLTAKFIFFFEIRLL